MKAKVSVLPDGSGFFTGVLPLPKDHWLFAPYSEWDHARDEFEECPLPILADDQRDAVIAAARYAIRGATNCGREPDFDPDALALNVAYALCGPCVPPAMVQPPRHAPQYWRRKLRGFALRGA